MADDTAKRVEAGDLVGAWRLERWSLVYEDGRRDEYPLGADAVGLILYTPDSHVSATLARRTASGHGSGNAVSAAGANSFA